MKESLNSIMIKEYEALSNLLKILERQHALIMKKDVFALEQIVSEIQLVNKEVAEIEMERRSLTKGEAMSSIITNLQDEELDHNYRKIKLLLSELQLQKDTNELLLKQGISFATNILNIINPNRNKPTYNSYGKFKK